MTERPWLPAPGDAGRWVQRRGRRFRILAVLLIVFAAALVGLASVAFRTDVLLATTDPVLVSTPGVRELETIRILLLAATGGSAVAVAVIGGRWLATGRALLEGLLGMRLGRRGGPPGALSLRRWGVLLRPAGPDREAWWASLRVGGSRLGAGAAAVPALVGVPLLVAGLGLEAVATSAPGIRQAAGVIAVGALLTALAALLAIPVLQTIRRREVVALRNATLEPIVAPRTLPLLSFALALPIAAAIGLAAATADAGSCQVFGARCLDLIVPADRAAADPRGPTMTVRFAILPSSSADARLLVIAVGGPGASGLESVDYWLEKVDSRLRRSFDIVFFDQRGVGQSGARNCPLASRAWDQAPAGEPGPARTFVEACLAEARVPPAELPWYRTSQVVGDLDAVRAHLGHERFVLLGESYGTELAQAYALAHPNRVEALVLDGPVDLALSPHEFWIQAAQGFGATLDLAFDACSADSFCETDLPDPDSAWDDVLARLRAGPVVVETPDGKGGTIRQEITLEGWEVVAGSAMYDPAGRAIVVRALAEAARGQWEYVGRLAGNRAAIWDDQSVSTFVYYAVTCGDARFASAAGGVDELLAAAEAAGVDQLDLGGVYYAGLPCVYWPFAPAGEPVGLSDAPFPVMVLTSTGDPITRADAARSLAARQPEAYLVETSGGPHVTFGRGEECVDDPVLMLLVDREKPPAVTRCEGRAADPHLPLTALDADDYIDPLDAVIALENEVWASPEYYWWDGASDLTFGCRFGGGIRLSYDVNLIRVTLFDCAWAEGLELDGTGTMNFETGDVDLRVIAPETDVQYRSTFDERTLVGTWEGEEIALE